MQKELDKIIRGTHPAPVEALKRLYNEGQLTRDDILFKYNIPTDIKIALDEYIEKDVFITAVEATRMWGLSPATVRKNFTRKSKRFREGEYRRSGKSWLVKISAMIRVYGMPGEKKEEER